VPRAASGPTPTSELPFALPRLEAVRGMSERQSHPRGRIGVVQVSEIVVALSHPTTRAGTAPPRQHNLTAMVHAASVQGRGDAGVS